MSYYEPHKEQHLQNKKTGAHNENAQNPEKHV
jgi:hypothetical protein